MSDRLKALRERRGKIVADMKALTDKADAEKRDMTQKDLVVAARQMVPLYALYENEIKALRAWAMAALSAGETREARRAAEAWSAHDASAEPRLVLAAAYEAANRHREARAVLEEWLSTHPDTPEARKMLQRIGGGEPAIKHPRHSGSTTRPTGNATLEADGQ